MNLKMSLKIFNDRSFLAYWIGFFFSAVGDAVFSLAIMWMIVETTGSALLMSTYLLLMGLPRLLFMLAGGVMADRWNPIKVMFWSDIFRALLMLVLFMAAMFGTPPIWFLFLLAILFGSVDAFYWPAANTLRRFIVSKESFTQSYGVIMGTMQLSAIIGPILAASMLALGGYGWAIAFNFISFLVSALTLRYIKYNGSSLPLNEQPQTKRSFKGELMEGLAFVWKTPVIFIMITTAFLANAGANGVGVGLPFLAKELGRGVEGLSMMSAGFGIGGVVGAIIFSILSIKNPTPRMTIMAFFSQGLAIVLVSLTGSLWQVVFLMALMGITSTAIQVIAPSVNQLLIPPHLMGRVSSVMSLVAMGSTPFAQAGAGFIVDAVSPHAIFAIGGTLEMLVALVAFFMPAIRLYGKSASKETKELAI